MTERPKPIERVVRYGQKYSKEMDDHTLMDMIMSMWVAFEDAAKDEAVLFIGSLLRGMVREAKARGIEDEFLANSQARATAARELLSRMIAVPTEVMEVLQGVAGEGGPLGEKCKSCEDQNCPVNKGKNSDRMDPKDPDVQ